MKKHLSIAQLVASEHSRKNVGRVIRAVGNDQQKFDQLMKIFFSKDGDRSRTAAWAMSYIVVKHPLLISKWFSKVISNLQHDHHPAIYRNTFRFLEEIPIPEKYAAAVLDASYAFILNPRHPVAIRAFALSTAMNVVRSHSELAAEFLAIVKQVMTENSPAIRSRSRHILTYLHKMQP